MNDDSILRKVPMLMATKVGVRGCIDLQVALVIIAERHSQCYLPDTVHLYSLVLEYLLYRNNAESRTDPCPVALGPGKCHHLLAS